MYKRKFIFIFLVFIITGCMSSINAKKDIYQQMKEWKKPVLNITKEKVDTYLENEDLNSIEGIWKLSYFCNFNSDIEGHGKYDDNIPGIDDYKVAIIKDSTKHNEFLMLQYEKLNKPIVFGTLEGYFIPTLEENKYKFRLYCSTDVTMLFRWFDFELQDNELYGINIEKIEMPGLYMEKTHEYLLNRISNHITNEDFITDEFSIIGSGFLINNEGLILTNYHVIQDINNLKVNLPSFNLEFTANILLKDKNNDIAVLKLNNFNYSSIFRNLIPYTIIKTKKIKNGCEVYTIGYPFGELLGSSARVSNGIVNSIFGINDDPRTLQISNPIQPGNSGSPLFNNKGEIIGIVFSSLNAKLFYENTDIIPQNVNFAIKSDYLINLINMLSFDCSSIFESNNELSNYTIEEQVEKIEPYIVQIIGN